MNELTGQELDEMVATKIFGWKWLSWIGIPHRDTPGYPQKCRCRTFCSPARMRSEFWNKHWQRPDVGPVQDADGTEPLSYAYCSSLGPERVPEYSGRDDRLVLRWARESWEADPAEWRMFRTALGSAVDYEPGDYSRAALTLFTSPATDSRKPGTSPDQR